MRFDLKKIAQILQTLFDPRKLVQIFQTLSVVVTICTIITALTPSKADDAFVQKMRNMLDILAGNVLHNVNAENPSLDCNSCAANEQTEPNEEVKTA